MDAHGDCWLQVENNKYPSLDELSIYKYLSVLELILEYLSTLGQEEMLLL